MLLRTLYFLLLCLVLAQAFLELPESFPEQDLSQYKYRYISVASGNDTSACLQDQGPPGDGNKISCSSLRYGILGVHNNLTNQKSVERIIIFLEPGNYTYGDKTVEMQYFTSVVIAKLPGAIGEVVLFCEGKREFDFLNLYVTKSRYVYIHELVFERCGSFSPGMGTFEVEEITVENCIARNNTHTGIIMYQTVNSTILNCTFEDNYSIAYYNITPNLNPGEIRFAGGLSISWLDLPHPGFARIVNCTFTNNTAFISQRNMDENRPSLYIPQGHGGAMTTHFSHSDFKSLSIEGTVFRGNKALYNGGGIYFTFYNESMGNRITVRDSVFEDNLSEEGAGGAVSMSTFYKANDNLITAEGTVFRNNSAEVGGGAVSINIQDQLIDSDQLTVSNAASFESCLFKENSSPDGGSAISLISNARVDQALVSTNFSNCEFLSNTAKEEGAVMCFRFPIAFTGQTIFKDNEGGGVATLQSRLDLGGWLWFEGNSAGVGGAIALRDTSLIYLLPEVNATFVGNHADTQGGAISVISPSAFLDTDIIRLFNTQCFIQYDVLNTPDSVGPSLWNARLQFLSNTAGINGAAVYATDLNRCSYTPDNPANQSDIISERSIFKIQPLFHFSDNKVVDNSSGPVNQYLATSPSQLLISPQVATGAPGEVLEFRVQALDQSGNNRRAVWSLDDNSLPKDSARGQEYFVLTPAGTTHLYTVRGSPGVDYNCLSNQSLHSATLQFHLIQIIAGDIASTNRTEVGVTCCHPGYNYNTTRLNMCAYDNHVKVILRGDPSHRYLYIEPQHYAEARDGKIVSAILPPTFQKCTMLGTLRGCLFKFDSVDEQCANNRTGFLCGRCPENQGLDLTLRTCRECTAFHSVLVTIIFLLFLVACSCVLLLNIGVPNDLKGCFFFVQVVGFVYQGSGDTYDYHLSRAFASFYLPFCPTPYISAYVTASYGIILSFLPVLAIIVYSICARFIKKLGQHSSLEGIWLLAIVAIKYAADAAFITLRCQKVIGEGGDFVYFYDGTKKCFAFDDDSKHLGFAIAAIIVLILVGVVTFGILIVSYRRFKYTQAFTDVLTKGIKVSRRWWSWFDVARRLLFVIVEFLLNYIQPDYSQLAQFALGLAIFLVFVLAHPYDENRSNFIEGLIMLDLLVLTGLFLNTGTQAQSATSQLAVLLLLLPFIYAGLYVVISFISIIWRRLSPTSFMSFCQRLASLAMPSNWGWKVKGGISHDLETIVQISQTKTGAIVEQDLDDGVDLSSNYTELREALLDNSAL